MHLFCRLSHAGHLAAEKKIREIMCKQERLLEQLVVMTLNDDDVLVQQTCNLLSELHIS